MGEGKEREGSQNNITIQVLSERVWMSFHPELQTTKRTPLYFSAEPMELYWRPMQPEPTTWGLVFGTSTGTNKRLLHFICSYILYLNIESLSFSDFYLHHLDCAHPSVPDGESDRLDYQIPITSVSHLLPWLISHWCTKEQSVTIGWH